MGKNKIDGDNIILSKLCQCLDTEHVFFFNIMSS